MYNDPSGEFIGAIFTAIKIISAVFSAVQIIRSIDALVVGRIDASEFGKGIFFTIFSKVVSLGIGDLFRAGGEVAKALGGYTFLAEVGPHAFTQGVLSTMQGGSFGNTFWKGLGTNLAFHGIGKLASIKNTNENAIYNQSDDVAITTSLDADPDGYMPTTDIPGMTLSGKQKSSWGSQMRSHINSAIADLNLYQSRLRLANAIKVCNVCQEITAFENFLFYDTPQMFLGGGIPLIRAGGVIAKTGTQLWTSTSKLSSVVHWKKHGAEFSGFINAKQYVEGAKNFMHNSPAGTLMKTRINGDILKYHPRTNTFGVMKASGVPRTMFKPTNGMEYWLKIK